MRIGQTERAQATGKRQSYSECLFQKAHILNQIGISILMHRDYLSVATARTCVGPMGKSKFELDWLSGGWRLCDAMDPAPRAWIPRARGGLTGALPGMFHVKQSLAISDIATCSHVGTKRRREYTYLGAPCRISVSWQKLCPNHPGAAGSTVREKTFRPQLVKNSAALPQFSLPRNRLFSQCGTCRYRNKPQPLEA